MSAYVVESGVPLVPSRQARRKYPFHGMKVGDSFVITELERGRVSVAACWHTKRYGPKFSIRKRNKETRVWRVK